MFVLLALAFAGTFVIFGVGSGGSGLGDLLLLNQGSSAGNPSASDAREQIAENPKNAAAHYELAQALQTDGDLDGAISALNRYVELRPRDRDKLTELAGLHLAKAQQLEDEARAAQFETQLVTGGGLFNVQLQDPKKAPVDLGTPSLTGIEEAVSSKTNERFSEKFQAMSTSFQDAKATYERIAKLAPDDPTVQIGLAQAAQQAGDTQTAIKAYERFLELAPDDASAGIVKETLKELKASSQPTLRPVPSG